VTSSGKSGGLGTGGAVGLTIGLVALVAIICSIIYYCWRRRQQVREEELAGGASRRGSSAGLGGPIPSRTMSENSRYVLGTDGRQVVEAWEPADTPGSRRSRLMPVDQRLDPFAPLYQRGDGSKSRESINTIRDDQDYSRRVHQTGPILRATNPDE
jgi:cell wall integrity and stress response component